MNIFHGKIISLDTQNSIYSYLVEQNGRISHVGDTLPDQYQHNGTMIDLGTKSLIPCFGDGHIHFSNWALIAASFFDVRQARNIPQVLEIINEFVSSNKKRKVILAFGLSRHRLDEQRMINARELDTACPDIPMIMVSYDGHSAVCNTGLMKKFPEEIHRLRGFDIQNGHLLHEAFYKGLDYATSMVPPMDLVKSIIKGYDLLARKGVGMIHPVEGIGFPMDLDIRLVKMIAKARSHMNHFQTRTFFQTMDTNKVVKQKFPRIGGCFATAVDGCFGACDAALHEPYSHDPENKGILAHDEETLMKFVKTANRKGLQIALHAIGDAAVTRAVNAIEAALKDFPREDHRHTIIHACMITPDDLLRIARLDIHITLQPGFLISPLEPVSYLNTILGDRLKASSPLKSILDAGIHLSGGSDAPVIHPDPIEGIYGACNHPYDPEQSVSIMDALKMFTYEVAHTSFDDHQRGSLETGKLADMVILNKDPLSLNPKDLRTLKVETLYLNGREYQPGMNVLQVLQAAFKGRKELV